MSYCPNCGADIPSAAGPDRLYEKWIRPVLVIVGAATLVVGLLALLLVFLASNLEEGDCFDCTVTFHNKTDARLCALGAECSRPIEPGETADWTLESCVGLVTIYTSGGREIYRGFGPCQEWDDGFILINQRDGEFVVADSINAEILPPRHR